MEQVSKAKDTSLCLKIYKEQGLAELVKSNLSSQVMSLLTKQYAIQEEVD